MTKLIVALDNLPQEVALQRAVEFEYLFGKHSNYWGVKGHTWLRFISGEKFRALTSQCRIFADMKVNGVHADMASVREYAMYGARFLTVRSDEVGILDFAQNATKGSSLELLALLEPSTTEVRLNILVGRAKLAIDAGLSGVICPAYAISKLSNNEWLAGKHIVVMGVRFDDTSRDEHAHTVTLEEAMERGATHVVMGRPLLKNPNPPHAIDRALKILEKSYV